MKTLFFVLFIVGFNTASHAAVNEKVAAEAKSVCLKVFEKNITALYDGTSAESVRMSSRAKFTPVPAKKSTVVLAEVEANFYVKWAGNKGEVPELAGANMVYSVTSKSCKSVGLLEFIELKK